MISQEHAATKQPVSAVLAGPYGHPFHPILVTIPIGAWIASVVFDIGSRLVGHPSFQAPAAEWLIAIGVVGAVAAASIGFLDFFSIPARTPAYRTAVVHLTLNLLITAAYTANFFWRHASSPVAGHSVAVGPLVLSVVSLIALTISGTLGGRLAYHFGIRVADETTQAEGFVVPPESHH